MLDQESRITLLRVKITRKFVFEVQPIRPTERLYLALISYGGYCCCTLILILQKIKNLSLKGFLEALMRRFGDNGWGLVYERIALLRQTDGVEEYIQEFELSGAQANPNEIIVGVFL